MTRTCQRRFRHDRPRHRRGCRPRLRTSAACALVLVSWLLAVGCTGTPTPYQPLAEEGGYEETRLQEAVYRVSFKANRYTQEGRVLDFLFLRCAELTRQSGYTHFMVQEDFGRTRADLRPSGPRASVGLGFGLSSGRSFWHMGFGAPLTGGETYRASVRYHLAMFVIRMLQPEEAAQVGDAAFDAAFLLQSLAAKRDASREQDD